MTQLRSFNEKQSIDKIIRDIKSSMDIAVLGMSGGADSSLCAILCLEALGKDNVFSLHMPYSPRDYSYFNKRSLSIAKHLGINAITLSIKEVVDNSQRIYEQALEENLSTLNVGNLKSRERMKCLYTLSHHLSTKHSKKALVIGTGNLSEDFIGYDTKYGDSAADLFIIGDLLKLEVYKLLDYFCQKGCIPNDLIDRVPSAGLWDHQTDEAELGYSYMQMAPSILELQRDIYSQCSTCHSKRLNLGSLKQQDLSPVKSFVFDRHIKNRHKHLAPRVTKIFN